MAHESNWSGWLKRTLRQNTTTIHRFQTTALIPQAYVEPLEIRRMLSVGASDTLSWGDTHLPNPSVGQLLAANSIVTLPKLSVLGNNVTIANNDTTPGVDDRTDFGMMSYQNGAQKRIYTLKNTGDATLTFTGNTPVTFFGGNNTDFFIVAQPTGTIAPGATKTIEVRFDPNASGLRQTTLQIATNDPLNPTYRFAIRGTGGTAVFVPLDTDLNPGNDIRYITTQTGTGQGAGLGSGLVVDYTGNLTDGNIFDTSLQPGRSPIPVTLGISNVIQGWTYGLQGIKAGETRTLIIPPQYGYGSTPKTNIPANSWLVFEVTAHSVSFPVAQLIGNNVPVNNRDNTPSSADGTDFGSATTRDQVTREFVFRNIGPANSDLFPRISFTGSHKDDFALGAASLNSDGDYVIPLIFTPSAAGKRNATITLFNADPNQPQYSFAVTGTGVNPTVTIIAPDDQAGEMLASESVNPGVFRISTGASPTTRAMVVNFTISGSGTRGELPSGDYSLIVNNVLLTATSRSITIPAGQSFVDVWVVPFDDTKVEPTETVIMTLATGTSYGLPTVASQRTATVSIIDNEPTVSILATDEQAGEKLNDEDANTGTFRISRVGVTNTALVVNFTLAGTATRGNLPTGDYIIKVGEQMITTGIVTIPAGQTYVDVTVVPHNDNKVEADETVQLNLAYSTAYTLPTALNLKQAVVTILDNEPTITVEAIDALAGETLTGDATDLGTFRIRRTGVVGESIVVNFTVAGTALRGQLTTSDYILKLGDTLLTTNSVTIPADAEYVDITVVPTDDTRVELTETVQLTLSASTTYRLPTVLNQKQAVVSILDNEPTISVEALDHQTGETVAGQDANLGMFRIHRGGVLTQPLTVNFTVAGTATRGLLPAGDYVLMAGDQIITNNQITFTAGQTQFDITVVPGNDAKVENDETVIMNLTASPNYSLATLVAQRTATVTILDNEPTITVEAIDNQAGETLVGQEANLGTFRIRRTGVVGESIVVNFTVAGTALRGQLATSDYILKLGDTLLTTNTVTIPADAEYVDITVVPTDDTRVELTETVQLTLSASTTYRLPTVLNQKQGVVSILDNEPTLRVEVVDGVGQETLPQAGETNNIVFRVHRSGVSNVPVTFGFGFSGTSLRGFNGSGDYALEIDGAATATNVSQWTMPAGTDVAEFRLIPVSDGLVEASETVIFDLRAGTTYSLIADTAQRRGQAVIHDLAEPVVKVEVTDAAISERNPTTTGKGQFKFTREGGDLSQPVTIRYTLGGTATMDVDYTGLTGEVTIPAGLRTALVDLIPVDDLVTEGTETVTLTLLEDAGYRIKPAQKTLSANITDWETAPDNLNGLFVQMSIIGGTAPFAKSGSQRLMTGSSDNIYATTNGSSTPGVPSSGTFTFDKITNDKAVMEIADDTLGNLRGELTFSSAASAKYEFFAGNDLIQKGYMSTTRNTNGFYSLSVMNVEIHHLNLLPSNLSLLTTGPGIPLTGDTTSVTTIGGLDQPYQAGVTGSCVLYCFEPHYPYNNIVLNIDDTDDTDESVTIDDTLIADGILMLDDADILILG